MNCSAPKSMKKYFQIIIQLSKRIYTPLVLVLIFYLLFKNYGALKNQALTCNIYLIFISATIWGLLHVIAAASPYLILNGIFSYSLSFKSLMSIYFKRIPIKYLPGGIWHTVGRLSDYRALGVQNRSLSQLALFEFLFPIPVTFLLGSTFLLFANRPVISSVVLYSIIAVCFFSILVMATLIPKNKQKFLFYLVLFSIIYWIIASASFYTYTLSSISTLKLSGYQFIKVSGSYLFSWGTGYISFFAPQGIGVFEVLLSKLLQSQLSVQEMVTILFGYRVILVFADLCSYGLFMLLRLNFKTFKNFPHSD